MVIDGAAESCGTKTENTNVKFGSLPPKTLRSSKRQHDHLPRVALMSASVFPSPEDEAIMSTAARLTQGVRQMPLSDPLCRIR